MLLPLLMLHPPPFPLALCLGDTTCSTSWDTCRMAITGKAASES